MVAACLDLGVPFEELKKALSEIPLRGYEVFSERVKRGSISCIRFWVEAKERQPVRRADEILSMIWESGLQPKVKARAKALFELLRDAEAKVHGIEKKDVHFHEVGAIDSIVDIVSVSFCLEWLGVERMMASQVPVSTGWVETLHGNLPLPAPATLELLKGVPVYGTQFCHEIVTPTGAAILKAFSEGFGPMPPMVIKGIGMGAGKRETEGCPNALRLIRGEPFGASADTVIEIRANIDDREPYELGLLMETLFQKGALDVCLVPCYMKKSRPGVQLQVLGRPEDLNLLSETLFDLGISLGLRYDFLHRILLERKVEEVHTPWGPVKVKKATTPEGKVLIWPEYEDMKNLHREKGVALWEIKAWIIAHAR